jgi:hypothetical protein
MLAAHYWWVCAIAGQDGVMFANDIVLATQADLCMLDHSRADRRFAPLSQSHHRIPLPQSNAQPAAVGTAQSHASAVGRGVAHRPTTITA